MSEKAVLPVWKGAFNELSGVPDDAEIERRMRNLGVVGELRIERSPKNGMVMVTVWFANQVRPGGTSFDSAAPQAAEVTATFGEAAPSNRLKEEQSYVRGYRAALTGMLAHCLSELGYEDTEATRARWIVEREATIAALRDVCRAYGDNDWDKSLHLADVVEKHLGRSLDAELRRR